MLLQAHLDGSGLVRCGIKETIDDAFALLVVLIPKVLLISQVLRNQVHSRQLLVFPEELYHPGPEFIFRLLLGGLGVDILRLWLF